MAPDGGGRSVPAMPPATIPATAIPGTAAGRMETPVRALMRPGVVAISHDASLLQAQRAMLLHGTDAVLLLGPRSGRPVGWVTSRGVLDRLGEDPALVPAGAAVTEVPVTVQPAATAAEAALALSQPGVGRLLVGHRADAPPEGVVTPLDLIAVAAAS
jgi:CBS domain-containing protein